MGGKNRSAPMMRIIGALAVLAGQVACYVYQPVATGTAPVLGQMVAVDITDAGRVALGGSMGPEIRQIEGRLVRDDEAEYELGVTAVRLLRGGEQGWAGERVRVRKEHVSHVYEKQLSRGRTTVASVGAVVIVAVFIGRKLIGNVTGDEGKLPTDSAGSQRRPPRVPVRP